MGKIGRDDIAREFVQRIETELPTPVTIKCPLSTIENSTCQGNYPEALCATCHTLQQFSHANPFFKSIPDPPQYK